MLHNNKYDRLMVVARCVLVSLVIFLIIAAGHNRDQWVAARADLAECRSDLADSPITQPMANEEPKHGPLSAYEREELHALSRAESQKKMTMLYMEVDKIEATRRAERLNHEMQLKVVKAKYQSTVAMLQAESDGRAKEIRAQYEKKVRGILAKNASAHGEGGALIIKDGWKWNRDDFSAKVYGELINKSSFVVTEVRMQFLIKDKDENPVESVFYIRKDISLAPGQRMEFWIRSPSWQDYYADANINITHVVYEWRS